MAARGDKSESRRLSVSREGIVGLHLLRELFPPVSIGPVLIYAENRLRIYIPGHELLKKKERDKSAEPGRHTLVCACQGAHQFGRTIYMSTRRRVEGVWEATGRVGRSCSLLGLGVLPSCFFSFLNPKFHHDLLLSIIVSIRIQRSWFIRANNVLC